MSLAQATQTATYDPEGDNFMVSREGKFINEALGLKISEFVWETIAEAFKYSNEHREKIPAEESLYDFFKTNVQQTDFSKEEQQLCLDACKLWGAYVGEPTERQSLRFFRLEECIDGCTSPILTSWPHYPTLNMHDSLTYTDNYFVAGTYKKILDQVSKTALAKADIKLNNPVTNINAPPRGTTAPSTSQITVTTLPGSTFTFDDVVITCPLGWLKANSNAFTPSLPPRLQSAIDSISYGRLEKVFVRFPRAFWKDENAETNPVFTQFLEPDYAEHPEHLEWNQECLSIAALPPPCDHPTLLFYTYGPGGAHIVNQIADLDPESKEYKDVLVKLLEPFYSKLPGYDAASADCMPSSVLATRWQLDQYAGYGSYCNFQVGLEEGDRDIEVMRGGDGVGEERGLWFAGEHTAPFVALGTTTGAYWSGERVAGQVCARRGLSCVGALGGRDDSLPSANL